MARFLVIEGLDGAGTTTQAARLCEHLRAAGRTVVASHEPTDGPVGRVIRATLRQAHGAPPRDTLPWLFAADRCDHLVRLVEPALVRGDDVVSDRYYHSSLAYQSMDLPLEWVHALNARFRTPDLTLFLDAPVDVCLARIATRDGVREIFEHRDQLERIHARYQAVLEHLMARGEPIVRIDATQDLEAVTAAVYAAVEAA